MHKIYSIEFQGLERSWDRKMRAEAFRLLADGRLESDPDVVARWLQDRCCLPVLVRADLLSAHREPKTIPNRLKS